MSAEDSPLEGSPPEGAEPADATAENAVSDERLAELKRRWEADPTSKVYLQLAEEYRKAERYAEAIDVLEKSLEHRPRDPRGRVALARCRMETGDVPEAAELLEHVTRQDPAHVVANKLLLEVYLQLGDADKAAERLNIYRLLNDRDPELDHFEYRLERLGELTTTRADRAFRPASDEPTPTEQVEALAAEATGSQPTDSRSTDSQPTAQAPPAPPIPSAVPVPPPVASFEPAAPGPELIAEAPAFELEPIEPEIDDEADWAEPIDEPETPPSFEMLETPEASDEPTFDDVVESPRDDDEPTFDDVVSAPATDEEPTFDALASDGASDGTADDDSIEIEATPVETPPPAPTLGGYQPEPEIDDEPATAEDDGALFDLAPPPEPNLDDLFGLEAGEPTSAPDLGDLWGDEPAPPPAVEEPAFADEAVFEGSTELEGSTDFEIEPEPEIAPPASHGDGQPATVTLGQLYLQQGHFDEAERIFLEILERDPDHEAARDGLSIIQARRLADADDASAPEPPVEEPPVEEPPVEEPPVEEPPVEEPPVEEPPVEEPPVDPTPREVVETSGAETSGVTAARLLARRDIDEHPEGLTDKKILVLRQYAKHLRRGEEHVS